jgi:hypothetical protein
MTHDPKRAAAIAAVAAYITAEEAAFAETAEDAGETEAGVPAGRTPGPWPSVWGLSGRQQQMQMRNLMQMKALHRGGGLR